MAIRSTTLPIYPSPIKFRDQTHKRRDRKPKSCGIRKPAFLILPNKGLPMYSEVGLLL